MRPRNDPRQYDDLAGEWWRPGGGFEILHWLAEARGALVPRAGRSGAVLVDAGCGGGLLAPHVRRLGYRHIGVAGPGCSRRPPAASSRSSAT
jgi:2-polyprenyl-6-hydroxyphenyl methylase/3-demethylubiquinone-9 3-methyltransferase